MVQMDGLLMLAAQQPDTQDGEMGLDTGNSLLAPFMKRQTRGCWPNVLPSKPTWHAEIAAKYTLTVENALFLSLGLAKMPNDIEWAIKREYSHISTPGLKDSPLTVIQRPCGLGPGTWS